MKTGMIFFESNATEIFAKSGRIFTEEELRRQALAKSKMQFEPIKDKNGHLIEDIDTNNFISSVLISPIGLTMNLTQQCKF